MIYFICKEAMVRRQRLWEHMNIKAIFYTYTICFFTIEYISYVRKKMQKNTMNLRTYEYFCNIRYLHFFFIFDYLHIAFIQFKNILAILKIHCLNVKC